MRALKITLASIIILALAVPLILNNANILINKDDIVIFTKMYPRAEQIRPKNLFFIDGMLSGFQSPVKELFKKNFYAQFCLECSYNPKKTLYRVRLYKKDGNSNYSLVGNVSFAGDLKEDMLKARLTKNMNEAIIYKMIGLYAEQVSSRDVLERLIRDKNNST